MKTKTIVFISILLFCSVFAFGQKNEFNLIKLDSTWGQEVLRFTNQILKKYKHPTKNNQYFEFYDCIMYQLEKRIRAITAKL